MRLADDIHALGEIDPNLLTAPGNDGKTPADLAEELHRGDIVALLASLSSGDE